jgi:hypothetical protein
MDQNHSTVDKSSRDPDPRSRRDRDWPKSPGVREEIWERCMSDWRKWMRVLDVYSCDDTPIQMHRGPQRGDSAVTRFTVLSSTAPPLSAQTPWLGRMGSASSSDPRSHSALRPTPRTSPRLKRGERQPDVSLILIPLDSFRPTVCQELFQRGSTAGATDDGRVEDDGHHLRFALFAFFVQDVECVALWAGESARPCPFVHCELAQ